MKICANYAELDQFLCQTPVASVPNWFTLLAGFEITQFITQLRPVAMQYVSSVAILCDSSLALTRTGSQQLIDKATKRRSTRGT